MLEQRRNRRFDLKFQIELLRGNGAAGSATLGETKNISSTGVLFAADCEVRVGEPIEYVIQLAGEQMKPVQLRCVGKVVRVEKIEEPESELRVAATLERHRFIRDAE